MIKTCLICGAEYQPTGRYQKYCGKECAAIAEREQNRIAYLKWRKKKRKYKPYPPRDIVCVKCGSTFLGRSNQKICRECLLKKENKKFLDQRSDSMRVGAAYERDVDD